MAPAMASCKSSQRAILCSMSSGTLCARDNDWRWQAKGRVPHPIWSLLTNDHPCVLRHANSLMLSARAVPPTLPDFRASPLLTANNERLRCQLVYDDTPYNDFKIRTSAV